MRKPQGSKGLKTLVMLFTDSFGVFELSLKD